MQKIKNWLLPILIVIGGILDLGFGLVNELAQELNIPANIIGYIRVAIVIVGAIVLKLQPPTTNPEKLQELAANAAKERKPE